jgi:predicted nucleotidyltransferase
MDAKIKKIAYEYQKGLRAIFGNNLVEIILYGSRARGDFDQDSDIDILCVMKKNSNLADTIGKSSDLTASLSLKHDITISRIFVKKSDYETMRYPFFMNVRREGVLL